MAPSRPRVAIQYCTQCRWLLLAKLSFVVIVGVTTVPFTLAQSAAKATPKFEVASIKPCKDGSTPGGRGGGGSFSPGSMDIQCQTIEGYIGVAYIMFADGTAANFFSSVPIEGGPAWIHSERYSINAKSDGRATPEMMQGPMLQQLLEDRLKLRIHRETKEIPVFVLTVANGGSSLSSLRKEAVRLVLLSI